MFTGIVEEAGEVVGVEDGEAGRRVRVAASFAGDLERGQSIAVSGACLTVEESDDESFELFLSTETLDRTSLAAVEPGDRVNLERALAAGDRFDGHVVQGHVDGTGEVTRAERVGEDWLFGFSLPADLRRYVVEKGSITVDGVSLTVASLDPDGASFTVAVIPATYELTNLSEMTRGDTVNLEVDVVAKYVESLVEGYVE